MYRLLGVGAQLHPWYPVSAASCTTSGMGMPGTPSVEKAYLT